MTKEQIVTLYDESGISVEDLSSEFHMPIDVIRIALASGSSKYRNEIKSGKIFADDVVENAKMVMGQLLMSENDSVRYRAGKFIINESEGRHSVATQMGGMTFNLNLINEQFSKAKRAIEIAKGEVNKQKEITV